MSWWNRIGIRNTGHGSVEIPVFWTYVYLLVCDQEDNFPSSISLKVNSRLCPLPPILPGSKSGVEPSREPEFMEVHSLHRLVILMGLKKVKYCKFFIGARFYEKKINFCYLCNTCSGFHWFTTESSQPLTEKSWKMYNGWINNISSIKHGKITTIINIKINIRIKDGKSQCKNQYKY